MKSVLLLLCSVVCLMAQARIGGFSQGDLNRIGQYPGRSFMPKDQPKPEPLPEYRVLNGKVYNAAIASNWVTLHLLVDKKITNALSGRRAIAVKRYNNGGYYDMFEPGPRAEIRNGVKTDFDEYRVMFVGTEDRNGSPVEIYEAGRAATVEEVQAEIARRQEEASQNALSKSEQERITMAPKVLAYQFQQASNGLGSFQLIVGKRYLTGDGVETNLNLARHWLRAACTNGEFQASNLLLKVSSL